MPQPPALTFGRRLGLAMKAFRAMMFAPHSGAAYSYGSEWGGRGYGGGGGVDWLAGALGSSGYGVGTGAGPFHANPTVAACLRVIEDNAPQPVMEVVETQADGDEIPVKKSSVLDLFRHPNPFYDYYTLAASLYSSLVVDGNSYLIKVKSGAGVPVELWWVPSWMMVPRWPVGDPSVFIGWYEYRPGNGVYYSLDVKDVIHFRYGKIDERNDRLMVSPLKAAGRVPIHSLNEVDNFTATLMRHGGVPPIVIRPTVGGRPIGPDEAAAMTADYRTLLDGERKGDPFIATGPFEVVPLGFSPEQLAMDKIPARLEDQICSLTGVPAMLAGLTSGAQHKTYANVYESRRSFYEETLIPLQARVAQAIDVQLLGDPGMGDPKAQRVRFSYAGIRCMEEDADKVALRAKDLWSSGVITRGDARRMIGLDADGNDDLYTVNRGWQFLRVGEKVPPFQAMMPVQSNPNLPPGSGGGVAPPTPDGAGTGGGTAKAIEFDGDDDESPMLVKADELPMLPAPEREDGIDPFPATEMKATAADDGDDEATIAHGLLSEALDGLSLTSAFQDGSITDDGRHALLAAISDLAASQLKQISQEFLDAHPDSTKALGDGFKAGLAAWAGKVRKTIGGALLAGALALFGPKGLPPNEQAILARANAAQQAFFDNFVADVGNGKQKLDGTFPARAAMYGAVTHQVAENVRHGSVMAAGVATEERRVLGAHDDHTCQTCIEQADLGWQKPGVLLPLGDSECMSNCRCHWETR